MSALEGNREIEGANHMTEEEADRQADQLLKAFKEENPSIEKYVACTFSFFLVMRY